ncbi:MAG: hypothetical protein MJ192_01015 [Clostridia bacterium]|nr:hypothetical protein [Clostridia bacterium]
MKKVRKSKPMSDRTYTILLFSVIAVCLLGTAALVVYTAYEYHYVSIIRFIAGERWWGV